MRAIAISITAVVLLALAAPANAQYVTTYDPNVGAYVAAPTFFYPTTSPYGPRVWGPGGYYSYQPYAYNTASSYGYSLQNASPYYYPYYNTYTYRYWRP